MIKVILAFLCGYVFCFWTTLREKEKGALSYGVPLDTTLIKCEEGEPYYGSVTITTRFDTMMQNADVSWQCHEYGGARRYIHLDPYHLTMKRDEP